MNVEIRTEAVSFLGIFFQFSVQNLRSSGYAAQNVWMAWEGHAALNFA
jgi:hypothetical protein